MTNLLQISGVIIFIWSLWCILNNDVNDGIIGKLILSFTALAAFALIVNPPYTSYNASVALHVCFALIALRQMAMRYIWNKIFKLFNKTKRASDI